MSESTSLKISPLEKWLLEFDRYPAEALDRLLLGKAYMGRLDRNDTDEILFRLFHAGAPERRIALERAMLQWFQSYWENAPAAVPASRWGEILQNAFATVARLQLRVVQDWLLAHYGRGRTWLRGLYLGPARDPEAALLRTLALAQHDLRLLPLWMRLCRLEEDRPLYYAGLGLLGLRKLPGENDERHGDLHTAVFRGLMDLANAIDQKPSLRQEGQEFWFLKARALMARQYPRSTQYWTEHFYPLVYFQRESAAATWLGKLIPRLRKELEGAAPGFKRKTAIMPPSRQEQETILDLLQRWPLQEVRAQLQTHLSKHRYYAHQTGFAEYLVKTFSNIAFRIFRQDPNWALALVKEAFLWAPYNDFLWTERAKIEAHLGRHAKALSLLWEAKRRFPEIAQIRTQLAELLRREGKNEVAEQVYCQTTIDFPNNAVCRNGLAEVLKAQGKLEEAEKVYRQALKDFPKNAVCRTGLAEVLKAQGKLEEAEKVYRQALKDFPKDAVCRTGLAEVLKAQGKLEEAEKVYRQAMNDFPQNAVCRNGLAEVLRAQGKLEEAEKVYRQAMNDFPKDAVCRNGLAEVLKAQGKLEEAEKVYRQALKDFPKDAVCRTGLAEVLKAQGKLEDAEKVYRQAMNDFPQNAVCRTGLAEVLRAQGKLEEAEKVYRQAMNDFSKDAVCRNGLAVVLLLRGERYESVQLLEKTTKDFPNNLITQELLKKIAKPSEDLAALADIHEKLTAAQEQTEQAEALVDQSMSSQEEQSPQEISPALSSEATSAQRTEEREPLPQESFDLSSQTETLEPAAGDKAPILADDALSFEESSNGDEMHLGLANLYRLAARQAPGEVQARYRELFREALAQVPQNIFAALEEGFELLDRDPQSAATYFAEHIEHGKQPHVLGLRLGYLQARRKKDEALPATDWQALFEIFPNQKTLIALAAAQAELRHGNGTTISALETLRKQMQAPLANLPSGLQANEQWVRATVEKRLFAELDLAQPFTTHALPLVLSRHAQHDFILQGVLEQSLTNF